ncbi:MAG: hypothetical protein KAX80_09125, partial [Planctomycetes bacterium]|nr:hypothetical protein [Planctomycetota bacterium]
SATAPEQERRLLAAQLRRRWEAGELVVRRRVLSPLATVVAVRRGGELGDELIARLLPQASAAGAGGLIPGLLLPILRDGVEVAQFRVERTFADGSALFGRSVGDRGVRVREGDRVFAPVPTGRRAGEPPEDDQQGGGMDEEPAREP